MTDRAKQEAEYQIHALYSGLRNDAWKQLLKDKYKLMYRMKFDLQINLSPQELELSNQIKDLKTQHEKLTNKKYFHFVTIRPSQDIDRELFKERLDSFIDKNKYIDEYAYVFEVTDIEYRKKDNKLHKTFKGFHCHLLMRNNKYEKGKLIRDIYSSINRSGKNFQELITDRAMIDVDHRKYDHFQRTIEYMEGRKKDPEKKVAINSTIEFRRQFPQLTSRAHGYLLDLLDTHV